jgi:hypothetical protein
MGECQHVMRPQQYYDECTKCGARYYPSPIEPLRSQNPIAVLLMLTDAFLSRHGSFPLDMATPQQREWNQAMTAAYSFVGPPGSLMRANAQRAASDQPWFISLDLASPEPEGTTKVELFRVVVKDNFDREGPGHDDKWACPYGLPKSKAEELCSWLNTWHATAGGDFWAVVVPSDYQLRKFEP